MVGRGLAWLTMPGVDMPLCKKRSKKSALFILKRSVAYRCPPCLVVTRLYILLSGKVQGTESK